MKWQLFYFVASGPTEPDNKLCLLYNKSLLGLKGFSLQLCSQSLPYHRREGHNSVNGHRYLRHDPRQVHNSPWLSWSSAKSQSAGDGASQAGGGRSCKKILKIYKQIRKIKKILSPFIPGHDVLADHDAGHEGLAR